jgi:anti-sigma-K factor RskA
MSVPADINGLAAEYVLGTLDGSEREQAQQLLSSDDAFASEVRLWERRLGELHLMVEPVEPSPEIWQRIKAKLPEPPPVPEPVPQEEAQEQEAQQGEPPHEPAAPAQDAAIAAVESAAETLKAETETIPSLDWAAFEAEMEEHLAPPAVSTQESDAAVEPVTPTSEIPSVPAVTTASPETPAAVTPTPVPLPAPAAPAPARGPTPPVTQPPTITPAVAPTLTPRQAAPPAVAGTVRMRRRLVFWRSVAGLLTVVVLAFAALLASWRFAPDRLPPVLQPAELMRFAGIYLPASPPRRPAPPESRYDE